ncbi:MAG: hypothetical protein P8J27_12890 [Mariniblastus sp.]|nr:hypothetical protein [Mariniblastus sp.]
MAQIYQTKIKSRFLGSILTLTFLMSCSDLAGQDNWVSEMRKINGNISAPFELNQAAIQAVGIRKITGRHLDLYTDVRKERVEELVEVFDQSVDQLCRIFNIEPKKAKPWKLRAFLIADKNKTQPFKQIGAIPADLPKFLAGYQRGHNIWLYQQPGNYYTQHLLLHEATHGFMKWFLDGHGAPWYSEGVAELVGVHRWKEGQLQLNYRLRESSEADYWGRVKQIKEDWKTGNTMTLAEVMSIPPRAFLEVRYYAWSWAACDFLSHHAKTKAAFWEMKQLAMVNSNTFNTRFLDLIKKDWNDLERDWQLYLAEAEYGYEIERGKLTQAQQVLGDDSSFLIDTQQSWQTTSIKVKQGDRLRISGSGEFKVGETTNVKTNATGDSRTKSAIPWPCQSNGITIQYYRGQPLGMLQAGVFCPTAGTPKEQIRGLLTPLSVGISAEIEFDNDGILCFRINESPAHLDNNQGALEVTVEKLE